MQATMTNKFFWMERLLMRTYTTNVFVGCDQVGGENKHEKIHNNLILFYYINTFMYDVGVS